MRYDINSITSARGKEIARKTSDYLRLVPLAKSVALSIKDHKALIEAAQKSINAKAKKSSSRPERVDSIFIRINSRDIPFEAVQT